MLPDLGSPFRSLSSASTSSALDPYTNTAGRWLHRDELQRQSRSVRFDFTRLCETAIKLCKDATRITGCEKKEGGYNRAFILTMDTGKRVVAKIPTPIAGPPRLTTNSEVATILYLQLKTSLPIPEILDWNDDSSNPVGSEYIIQDHVDGVQLRERWPSMDMVQHLLCVKDLSLKIQDTASLDFPAYGNIYFADVAVEERLKIPLSDGFCIGPYCSPLFWNCGPGEADLYGRPNSNCGPWRDLNEYTSGLIDIAFARIPQTQSVQGDRLPFRGTTQDHTRLLNTCRDTMHIIAADKRVQEAAAKCLIHPDYNMRNIYVSPDDPTIVTGLIDWQLAAIDPAFMHAHSSPDFAALPEENPAEGENEPRNDDEKRLLKDISICCQAYDAVMKGMVPKVRRGRLLDSIFFRLFHYCFTTWRDGAPAIRQELLDLKAQWADLKLPGDCPFSPSEEELREHSKQYEDFETLQNLKTWLKVSLQTDSDGWVPNEAWKAAREANRAAYEEWMKTAKDNGMTTEKADALWPFDAR